MATVLRVLYRMIKIVNENSWHRAVDNPAPNIPRWKVKINNGSNPMLIIAPEINPIIDSVANPWKRNNAFNT